MVSTDGGQTYLAQSVEQAGNTFDVTLGPGETHHVKVVVTDGGRRAEAVSVFSSETPAELVARISAAYRAGRGGRLAERLDPAVIERYGKQQCMAFLRSVRLPSLRSSVRSERGPASWTWVTDRRSTVIPSTYTLSVDEVYRGARRHIPIHIAIRDGRLSWFADCGRPLAGN
jgi:hypothetical protein